MMTRKRLGKKTSHSLTSMACCPSYSIKPRSRGRGLDPHSENAQNSFEADDSRNRKCRLDKHESHTLGTM